MSRRIERVNSMIRTIVSRAIQTRLNDPRIPVMTSVTRVDTAPDLSLARVYVSVMERDARQKLAVTALQSAGKRIRGEIAAQLRIRQVPWLQFYLDDSVKQAFDTIQAIDETMVEHGQQLPWLADGLDEEADRPTAADDTADDASVAPAERTPENRTAADDAADDEQEER